MKLAMRIYLFTLLLFLLVFNAAGYINLEQSKNSGLGREVERSRNEEAAIAYGLWEQMPSIVFQDSLEITSFNQMSIRSYHTSFVETVTGVYVEILDENGDVVASNMDMELAEERPELNFSNEEERRTIIRDHGERSLIFVSSQVLLNGEKYQLTYARDISDFYRGLHDQWTLFFQSEALAVAVFSLFMLLISQSIAKPVKEMVKMTQEIANGQLERRVPDQKGHEFRELGQHLNRMAGAIQDNTIRLEQANSEKEQFIESFTHEMKTPLTSIIGYAEFIRNAKTDEETQMEALTVILEEGQHLERLSMKLMDLILLRKGTFEFEEKSIANILDETLRAMEPRLRQKEIEVFLQVEEGLWSVEADYFRVLISNVLDNAVKALDPAGQIKVSLSFSSHDMRLEVTDNGMGMDEAEVAHILEPFYMVDKARTRANHGAGLGLSICQQILEIHKGRFEIESRLNEGTTVAMVFENKEVHE